MYKWIWKIQIQNKGCIILSLFMKKLSIPVTNVANNLHIFTVCPWKTPCCLCVFKATKEHSHQRHIRKIINILILNFFSYGLNKILTFEPHVSVYYIHLETLSGFLPKKIFRIRRSERYCSICSSNVLSSIEVLRGSRKK